MAKQGSGKKKLIAFLGVTLALLLTATWLERATLLAWLHVRGLARAGESDRARWVERVASLGEAGVPSLVGLLGEENELACRNARAAIERLADEWGLEDDRTLATVKQLVQAFPQLSLWGQDNALQLTYGWLSPKNPSTAVPTALRRATAPLLAAAASSEQMLWPRALDIAAALLAHPQSEPDLPSARELVRATLQADAIPVRVQSIKLALHDGLDLLPAVVPLLQDRSAEVRRAAILAVGPADHLVRDENLLPCLHDPDEEVRRLCEIALQGRGLRPEHLRLGRLLTDPRPNVRLQVLDQLQLAPDLDPALWLRRLSHDPSPAVRAGAVRMMSQLAHLDLTDRIDQMARGDPSPTVSSLARFYLQTSRVAPVSVER